MVLCVSFYFVDQVYRAVYLIMYVMVTTCAQRYEIIIF